MSYSCHGQKQSPGAVLLKRNLKTTFFTEHLRWLPLVIQFLVNVSCIPALLLTVACTGSFSNMCLLIRFLEVTILAHDLFCNLMWLYYEHIFCLCNIWITSFLPVRWWIVRPVMSCFPFLPGVSKFSQSHAIAQILVPKSEDKVWANPYWWNFKWPLTK